MVRRLVCAAVFAGTLALPAVAAADGYVVVYRDGVSDPAAVTSGLERSAGFSHGFGYGAALKGFSARLSKGQLKQVEARPEVAYVVPDTTFEAASMQPVAAGETVPVGIRRLSAAGESAHSTWSASRLRIYVRFYAVTSIRKHG